MARQKKDGEHINLYLERIIVKKLRDYADEKGQTVTMALERILSDFFSKNHEIKAIEHKEK